MCRESCNPRLAPNIVCRLGVVAFAICAASAPLQGQGTQASILTGVVSDTTGAVLPRVTLTLCSPSLIGGPRTTMTDATGVYRFPALVRATLRMRA